MSFFRQYIAPLIVVIIFLFALVAVSARIFLPSDMIAPAPITSEELSLREHSVNNALGNVNFSIVELKNPLICFNSID
ncbi:MAG: hypothetical protein ACFCU5_02245 [Pleurocapsa sp.]